MRDGWLIETLAVRSGKRFKLVRLVAGPALSAIERKTAAALVYETMRTAIFKLGWIAAAAG